ncbi:MAG: sulfatase [Deltaproteobacteria bacterium]|nr:MAG: sulfatase [Deltaproteobacteria bacterium]
MLGRALLALLVLVGGGARALAAPPSVIFILLDTTRADRLSAWGNPRPTTPALDRLAADGVQFVRHFANAHATRPSMPQLMSGRYYHSNILGAFQTDSHPREMSFARRDPTAALLPALLRDRGYATAAVSAHTWIAADSELGRPFEHFELLPFTAADGHGDAAPLVDRAIALWLARVRGRPLFLYLHFMDMHIPRRLPEGEPRFAVPGYDWRARFTANGEPDFGQDRRRWDRHDARDFTDLDRAHYEAVYDTRLQYTDEQLVRLLSAVRDEDPGLRDTVIVVTADHGEELGEDGRIEHPASLADGVQHVPWIVAGGPVEPGRRCTGVTEHVDVVPTLLALLGLPLPSDVTVDGRAWFEATGRLVAPCGGTAAYYAWEDYRAVRAHRYLFEERPPGSFEARCGGEARLHRVDALHRRRLAGPGIERRMGRLRLLLHARLAERERAFRADRYDAPARSFVVRADFWRTTDAARVRCVRVDESTDRSALGADGWMWSGRGVTASGVEGPPLSVRLEVPAGVYAVDAAGTPIAAPPWLFGFARWRRKAFLPDVPSEFPPLGTLDASRRELALELPAAVGRGHHVLALRLTPPGATPSVPGVDEGQRDRLKALGYVQ